MDYHWNWSIFFQEVPSGGETYVGWILSGLAITLALSAASWVLASLWGTMMGVARCLPYRALNTVGSLYVEVFRNVPLLVQLFIWYFVVPEVLPQNIGNAVKQTDPFVQLFFFSWICLGFFTGARICEQVRSGIQTLLRTQQGQAAKALGLSQFQAYRFVFLPQTFRMMIPPMTSEMLNLLKNSAVCSTIGLLELTGQSRQLVDYTAQAYESFIMVTLVYLAVNSGVMVLMKKLEKRLRIPGLIGVSPK